MLNIDRRAVPVVARNRRIYSGGGFGGYSGGGGSAAVVDPGGPVFVLTREAIEGLLTGMVTSHGHPDVMPVVIGFESSVPAVLDYDRDYASSFGQYPTVMLITVDGDGEETIRHVEPKRHKISGLLDSIVWDLGEVVTGFIILKK